MKVRKLRERKLLHGVGINDADYATQPVINGKTCKCPFYTKWKSMFERCYSEKYHERRPTYKGCSIDSRWYSFMNFKAWMENQDWKGKALDKDILFEGNKVYGPDTCVFVTSETNSFLLDGGKIGSETLMGVSFGNTGFRRRPYSADCSFNGKKHRLGYFTTQEEAHQVWYFTKRKFAIELASRQSDPRVAAALIARFP